MRIVNDAKFDNKTIFDASIEFYRNNQIKGLATDTQKAYMTYVNAFMDWCGKDTPLKDITTNTIEVYIDKKVADNNKMVSIATNIRHLRRFFNFCVSRSYMQKFDVPIPKYEKTIKEPYTDEEIGLLLVKPKGKNWVEYRNWTMVNYFFATGQRLSTVINIKVQHLDLEHKRVLLWWNKDKIQKYMPLSTAITKILKEYIYVSDLQAQDFLFPDCNGTQLSKRGIEDAIKEFNLSRGVKKHSIHLFRHTFAKNYIVNGGSPVKLQKLLNHKTLEQSMQYVRLYKDDIADDLDYFNPLDNFKRRNYEPVRRKYID